MLQGHLFCAGKKRCVMRSKKYGSGWSWSIYSFLIVVVLTACSNSAVAPTTPVTKESPQVPSPTTSPPSKLGNPGCHPPSPLDTSNLGFPEAQGTTASMDLWTLFLGGVPSVGNEGKIIWRMGAGFPDPIHIVALGPYGQRILPIFLERHEGSNWSRPGGEVGTGFKFPTAGCWDLRVTGGTGVGDVWIVVK